MNFVQGFVPEVLFVACNGHIESFAFLLVLELVDTTQGIFFRIQTAVLDQEEKNARPVGLELLLAHNAHDFPPLHLPRALADDWTLDFRVSQVILVFEDAYPVYRSLGILPRRLN